MPQLSFLVVLALLLPACVGGGDGKDAPGGDDTGNVDTAPVDRGAGALNGTVTVQLYETDADGEAVELSWEDYGADFPFGAIFVAAYTIDETTNETTYYAEQVISAPSTSGDAWSLSVDLDDAEEVHVYAALDWWPDGVIGTSEPIGIYADLVPLVEGGEVNDVDIVINAPCPCGWDGGSCGGGGTYVAISGDVTIDAAYGGGDAKVMLYDSASLGPSYVSSTTPTATSDGAEGSYTLYVGADYGEGRLIGAWDDDLNGLIEPTDTWGAYVVAEESGNPITVAGGDLAGYDVLIPFGIAPALTPFVRLEGTIGYEDDFSSLPAGAVVYVAALRTRPSGDFSVTELERGYDWASFTGAELTGMSLDYLLVAPSSAVAYLWAYADLDNDGVLNEVGEPVASYGRTGRVSTGTTNQEELNMLLQAVVE